MSTKREIKYARENFGGVLHTTMNPEGPGVVRIHMIPPKFTDTELGSSVAIINGQDIIPVNTSWSILLAEFIKQVNIHGEGEISDAEAAEIMKQTVKGVRKVYPFLSKKTIEDDAYTMLLSFSRIARGMMPLAEVAYMSIGEYSQYMKAPHRMDIMVSAMTKNGSWHCNQKCVHCYAAGQPEAEETELSTEEWKRVIDKCREVGIPQLTFTGGEPTMREDLCELIDYAQWFVTRLNTNGIKLTPELCKNLKDVSLDSMQITFYSSEAAIHNTLVGAERFDDTVAGIKNALAAGLNLSINTPLCQLNKDYLTTLQFLHGLGVTYVTCSGLITTGNAGTGSSENTQLSIDEIKDILRQCSEYAFANGMEISFTSPGWLDSEFCQEIGITMANCGACLSNMAITPGGNVVPCQSWLSSDILGNMLTDEWEKIWNSPACVERREYSAKMLGTCPLRQKKDDGKEAL